MVVLSTRRHDCDGPWALTEAEAVDLGKLIPRITKAIHQTGGERAYILFFGEELAMPHFHLALLARDEETSKAAHGAMYERVEKEGATLDLAQATSDFAAAVRANLNLSSAEEHHQREMDTIARYEASDGQAELKGWLAGLPLVILTTRGRTSGKPRKVALVYCEHDGVYAVVGSGPDPIGGTPIHSNWYLNIVNDPRVTVRVGGDVFEAVARTATPEEKAVWWPRATAVWPDYDQYQANTTKDIPVVLLERTTATAS
jgi:deazaflavin-dependent oxidoreductase (nitroreductase family)